MSDLGKILRDRKIKPSILARDIGVDKSTITRWSNGRVPATRVIDIERITGIPREELRPDLYAPRPEQVSA